MLVKYNKMLDIAKRSSGNMDKNRRILCVLGILNRPIKAAMNLNRVILSETTAKTVTVRGITGICLYQAKEQP